MLSMPTDHNVGRREGGPGDIDPCYRDPDSPELPFLQVIAIIESRISHGVYTGRVPGIDTLAAELDFGRGTVGKAMRTMRAEGWLIVTPTRGYYVNKARPGYKTDPSAHVPRE